MEDKFRWYGKESDDRTKGMQTRSLFGKGLRDVLFTQKVGMVKSIKDGSSCIAKFYWSKEKHSESFQPVVDIRLGPNVDRDLRTNWGISENGTIVEFRLREDVPFPRIETLVGKISNFYMLRIIHSNPERKVNLTSFDRLRDTRTDTIKYVFPAGEMKLPKTTLSLNYEGRTFPIELNVLRSSDSLIQGESGYEAREGGLLVLDEEDNVVDLTLFGFDSDPYASRLFGILRIFGAGNFIREKLNAAAPEAILSEDREGLVRGHEFYRALAKTVNPVLEPFVEEEEKAQKGSKSQFSSETLLKHRTAIDALNKLYEELVGKPEIGDGFHGKRPYLPEFISFIRSQIDIAKRVVTPVALLVNCNSVPNNTEIYISTDDQRITVSPSKFVVDGSKAEDGLLIKMLHFLGIDSGISGNVSARALEHSSSIAVSVVDREIFYPKNGLEFHPAHLNLRDGKKRTLHLYVDIEKIRIGTTIDFHCESPNFELSTNRVQFSDAMKLNMDIGLVSIEITGHGIGQETSVIANANEFQAMASAVVRSKREGREPEHGGRFRSPDFKEIPNLKVQTLLRPNDGTILVNMLDPVNKIYFGDDPHNAAETKYYCQTRLADLVLDECLYEIVSKAWGVTLPRRFPNNPEIDIRRYIAEKKFELGPVVHAAFVTIKPSEQSPEPDAK
jgi:hypothetical protein